MTFREAIDALAQELGLPEWEPEESGHFAIAFEDGIALELAPGSREEEILLSGRITAFDANTPKEDLVKLLQLNGPAIKYHEEVMTIDRGEKALILQRSLNLKYMQDGVLIREVEGFLNNLEFWVNLTRKDASSPESDTPFMILP